MSVVLSDHVRFQAARRGIEEDVVRTVAEAPEQVLQVRSGREVRQSRIPFSPAGDVYLVRVVVDVSADVDTAVTVYRTSKIDKYWRST